MTGATWAAEDRWQVARQHVDCALEEGIALDIGCYLPGYICILIQEPHCPYSRRGCRYGRREELYRTSSHPHFIPVAIETLCVIGLKSLTSLKDLSRRIINQTGEEKSSSYLLQQLSIHGCTTWEYSVNIGRNIILEYL